MSSILFWSGGFGLLIPRLILGAMLAVHGWPKVQNLKKTGEHFGGMGFKPGIFWGTLAGVLEFFGGLAIIFAIAVPYVCLLLMGEFVTIVGWKWLKRMPFVGGWEFDAVIFALLLAYFTLYGGELLFFHGVF